MKLRSSRKKIQSRVKRQIDKTQKACLNEQIKAIPKELVKHLILKMRLQRLNKN